MGSLSFLQGIFPNPGIEPRYPTLQVDSLPAEPQGKSKNTGVGSLSLLQGIFPTQELNWGLLHSRQILYQLSYQGSHGQPRQHIKKQRHYFAGKGPSSQSYGFSSSLVRMWDLDHKESWALKNWCFSTVVLEKTLESPLDCKDIKPLNPKGNQSWIFSGRTDAETEASILWPPDVKNWLLGKHLMLGKIESRRRRGWDGWMTSPTRWTWVWVSSGSWWWTGRPGLLQSTELQRVEHDRATKLNWTDEPNP